MAKLVTLKVLLALVAEKGWSQNQLDASNTFLHRDLHEDVYISLLERYHGGKGKDLPSNPVSELHKCIYCLRQATRQWFSKFFASLQLEEFTQSNVITPYSTRLPLLPLYLYLLWFMLAIIKVLQIHSKMH